MMFSFLFDSSMTMFLVMNFQVSSKIGFVREPLGAVVVRTRIWLLPGVNSDVVSE